MTLKRFEFAGLILFVGLAEPAIGQTTSQRLDSLTAILAGLDRAGTFHGVVLLADQGRIVHHSAHGLAHKGYRVANRLDTKFNLGSMNKMFSLAFEPGSRWSYSNTGMLVLGKVIEVVTKQDYFDYVREHLYRPAGMANSDAYELDHVNPNLAVGYEKAFLPDGSKQFRNNVFMHVIRGGPAGGGYSTVEDLLRFAEALKAGKLVSPATFELLTTPKPELNSPRYGYGFGVDPIDGSAGHSGGFPGISSNLDIFKGTGYVGVVMSNYGGGSQPIVTKIRNLVRSRTVPATP